MSRAGVLYATYDGLLEPLGRSQVVPVVLGLAGMGFPMSVLSFEKPGDLGDGGAVEAMARRLAGAGVTWIRHRYHRRPSLPATAWDIGVGARVVRREVREGACRLVHARSYVPGLMGLRGMAGSECRLLFDMRGFWVDERVEAGRWRKGSLVVGLARRGERRLLEGAHHLVHLTRAGMDQVGRLAPGARLPPSSVVPTCVDLDRFRPVADPAALRRELGLGTGPVVIHTGTLSGWYLGPETFRLGAALLARTGGEFVILTREGELAAALAREAGVAARILTVPHDDVPRWLAAADVGLALVRPGFAKMASAPTKVGEYLAAGLAVVGTAGVGDLEEQFRDSPVAFAVDPAEDPAQVAARVAAALGRPGRAREARALARRHYDLEDGLKAYAVLYRTLGVEPCG